MKSKKDWLIKEYLSNIQVGVWDAGYIKVWPDWKEINYTPQYNKFYFICDGEGWLKIGDAEYYPKPGQLFLMPATVTQSYSTINPNTFTKYWCHFTAKIGQKNLFDIIKVPNYIDVKEKAILKKLFRELQDSYNSCELTASLKVKSAIYNLIGFYLDNSTIEEIDISKSSSIQKINHILEYIDNNLSRNITVNNLAEELHLHPNYFIRFFKKHLGTSPIDFINNKRVEAVKKLLETTDYPISHISEEVGVNNVYYLSKLFKSHTGFSPSEYRKKQSM